MKKVLLFTAPMTQLNTPYPATMVLTGFLRAQGVLCEQADLSIEVFRALMEPTSLTRILDLVGAAPSSPALDWFRADGERVAEVADAAVRFLEGSDPTLAHRISSLQLLPRGPRQLRVLDGEDDVIEAAFGGMGLQDRARYLASLFIDDVADVIREGVDPLFGLSRYGSSLAASVPTFDGLADALAAPATWVGELIGRLASAHAERVSPEVVGISVPFSGNMLGALTAARAVRRVCPEALLVLGGGYVNTELRGLTEARLFDFVDAVVLDDGEAPLLAMARGQPSPRTFSRAEGRVVWRSGEGTSPLAHDRSDDPTTDGLPLARYVSLVEMLNPMHRLWSDGRWNKLTLAHGCYWKRCTFCDTSLDYIARYEPARVDTILRRMRALIRETGETGFHFTDEAAPPALLRSLSGRLLEDGLVTTWWANIRFDRAFDVATCQAMADAGCVAVSGGLEVASDRVLERIEKGVSIDQVAQVTDAFARAGIMVHAYLMYGFPGQTLQDSVDALEVVRQLFARGCVHSAFWHRFAATVHSPIGRDPERFGIRLAPGQEGAFSNNDRTFDDPTGCDHDAVGLVLERALYNYMHGVGLDWPMRRWFGKKAPRPTVRPDRVLDAIERASVND